MKLHTVLLISKQLSSKPTMKLLVVFFVLFFCLSSRAQIVTNCALYNQSSVPAQCPPGTDYIDTQCYGQCPPNTVRYQIFTCIGQSIVYDCGSAVPSINGWCPTSHPHLYAGVCFSACLSGTRVGPCHCVITFSETSADKYGVKASPCSSDSDFYYERCYKQTCYPLSRIGPCACANL